MDATKLKILLAKDELEAVLQALEQPCAQRSELQQDWISLSGRYHQLQRQDLRGLRDQNELGIQRNQLREDLLLLIERSAAPPARISQRTWQLLQQLRWPLLILVISLLAVGLGTLPVREVTFSAVLRSTDLKFRLVEVWPDVTLPASRFDLGPLQEVRGGMGGWQYHLDQLGEPIELSVDSGGTIDIGRLEIAAQELLSLRCRDGEISLILGTKAQGVINVQAGKLHIRPGLGTRSYGLPPASMEALFWTAEPGAQLTFQPNAAEGLRLTPPLKISLIEFLKKDDEQLKSALLGGSLSVEGQDAISLQAGDFLELGALSEADFSLQQKQDTLVINLRGKANQLNTGSHRLYSQKPSLLEYWYHNKKVYLLVSLFVSLVGILWTIRTALREK